MLAREVGSLFGGGDCLCATSTMRRGLCCLEIHWIHLYDVSSMCPGLMGTSDR